MDHEDVRAPPVELLDGVVEHAEEAVLLKRLEQVVEGPHVVALHTVLVRGRKVDDLSAVPEPAQPPAGLDAVDLGHEDVKEVQVKSALSLDLGEKVSSPGKRGEDSGEERVVLEAGAYQLSGPLEAAGVVVADGNGEHDTPPFSVRLRQANSTP